MAENNRNRSDLHDQDWDRNRNRNRYNQDDQYQNYGGGNQRDQQWQNTGSHGNQYSEGNDWYRRQQGNRYDENYRWDQQAGNSGYTGSNRGSSGNSMNQWDNSGNRNYGQNMGRRDNMSNYGNTGRNDNYRGDNNDRGWWDKTRDEVSSWFDDDDAERRRRMDKMSGPYKGKGPKDYKRSEDRIREDVCDRLSDDDMLDATNINVQIQGNEVILTGTVENREQKRRAEDLVERISGVNNVENRIRVTRNEGYDMRNYTGTTDEVGGIGDQSGTTSEIIRDVRNNKNS